MDFRSWGLRVEQDVHYLAKYHPVQLCLRGCLIIAVTIFLSACVLLGPPMTLARTVALLLAYWSPVIIGTMWFLLVRKRYVRS